MKNHRRIALCIVLTLLSVAAVSFIFYNSSQTADDSTVRSSGIREVINRFLHSVGIEWELTEYFTRKAAHFIEFFTLGALLSATLYVYVPRTRMLCLALPAGAAVAVCDELIQSGSEGRSCQISDMVLDTSAVLTAVFIAVLIHRLILRRRKKKTEQEGEKRNE